MLDHLEMFFKEFEEDDFDKLNEDKFLSLAYEKEFSEKLSKAFGKWQTVWYLWGCSKFNSKFYLLIWMLNKI